MARLTPQVHQGMLTTYLLDGTRQTVELDDEMWLCWLRECVECCFRFTSPLGTFGVRRTKGRYWYVCLMYERQRYKHYLGKSELVTLPTLYRNAERVYENIYGQPPSTPLLALTYEELNIYQQHATHVTNAASSPSPLPAHTPDSYLDTTIERKPLTPREREVLAALAILKTNEQIASLLGMSLDTLKRHLTHLYKKLALAGRTHLVAHAKEFFESITMEDEGERRGVRA